MHEVSVWGPREASIMRESVVLITHILGQHLCAHIKNTVVQPAIRIRNLGWER